MSFSVIFLMKTGKKFLTIVGNILAVGGYGGLWRPCQNQLTRNFLTGWTMGMAWVTPCAMGTLLGFWGAYTPDYACLAAYMSFEGELIEQRLEIPRYKVIRPTEGDRQKIHDKLKSMNMAFSVSFGCLTKVYQPDNGDIVRITGCDFQTTGIYRVTDGETLYFYAFVQGGGIVRDYSVKAGLVTVSRPTKTDVERLQVALAKGKLEWLARHRMLKMVESARVSKGERYWYLSETFSICSDVDMYTKRHDGRHKNGNYFCAYGTAILFAQKVKGLIKEIAGVSLPPPG